MLSKDNRSGPWIAIAAAIAIGACSLANAPEDPIAPEDDTNTTSPGSGGASACDPSQCPGEDTTCAFRACVDGMCSMTFAGAGTPCNESGGTACNGAGTCVAKSGNGDTCSSGSDCASDQCVDGVCCDSACDGLCESCNVPGMEGTCSPHAAGTDPENECGGDNCNGAGACATPLGGACTAPTDCGSGNCVDGVCCDTACTGLCVGCNLPGMEGTCGPHPAGTDPENECAGNQACNGNGMCGCPPSNGQTSIGGPLVAYNYCWYLTTPGGTCDAACSQLGGSNLAVQAQNAWPNACSAPSAQDVVTMFFNQGNPGQWSAVGTSTACHSLGYGYTNQPFYGKCTTGTVNSCGAYPNEQNTSATRTTVCACFPSN